MESELEFSTIFEHPKFFSPGTSPKTKDGKDLSYSMVVDGGNEDLSQLSFDTVQPRTRTRWVEDNSVNECSCGVSFGFFNRRSHCRFCGGVFCSQCLTQKTAIPKYLTIPTPHTGKEFDDSQNVKVCKDCHVKVSTVKRIGILIEVFNLLDLDIYDLKTISQVSREWRQLANFYLSKIREIQYTLPTHKYDDYERNALWVNRKHFIGHNIWMTHLLRSIEYEKDIDKLSEIKIIFQKHVTYSSTSNHPPTEFHKDKDKDKNHKAKCWGLMCTRRCQKGLSSECALMLLDTEVKLPEVRRYAMEYLFGDNVSTDELCCYISYLIQTASRSKNSIIIDCLIEEISKFEVGKGMECNVNRRCLKIANEVWWELQIGLQNRSVFLIQKYQEMMSKFQNNVNVAFQDILLESQTLVQTIQENYNSDNPLDIVNSLGDIKHAVSPLNPEEGHMTIDASKVEVKQSITRPIIIPMRNSTDDKKQLIMYKNEDIRKDQIIMSIIKLMDLVIKKELGLDLGIITYNIRPTTPTEGFIEIVQDCCTLYKVRQKQMTLLNYILEKNPDSTQKELRDRFIKSCAAYCCITFLLGVGDRHLENIMITDDGRLFHIDYGFVMGQDPKPLKVSHIRISSDMLDALGGPTSPSYELFKRLCDKMYNVLRRHLNLFACMLGMFVTSQPRIEGSRYFTENKVLREISRRFSPGENYREAKIQLHNRIYNSTTTEQSLKYSLIDFFHKHNKEETVRHALSTTATSTYSATKTIINKVWELITASHEYDV